MRKNVEILTMICVSSLACWVFAEDGNAVDVKKATWKNTMGAPDLITVWKGPDFKPNQKTFYYARVIEIPTPRWSAYDALRFKTEMRGDVKMITQERAYTSPIWYTP